MPDVWVYSAWFFVPGPVDGLSAAFAEGPLAGAEQIALESGFLLTTVDAFTEQQDEDGWVKGPAVELNGITGTYVLDPDALGLASPEGNALVGIASTRPAANAALTARTTTPLGAIPLLPVLSKRALVELSGLTVYEARTETDDRELSVIYLDPSRTGVLDEWPDDASEFGAITLSWEGHLVTLFPDGQILFDGITPDRVPSAIQAIAVNLWSVRDSADGVH